MALLNWRLKRLLWRVCSKRSLLIVYLITSVWLMLSIMDLQTRVQSVDVILYEEPKDLSGMSDCRSVQYQRRHFLHLQCKAEAEERRLRTQQQFASARPQVQSIMKTYELRKLKKWLGESQALVLEKERAIYCFVPKVGCSSWKTKILENRGIIHANNHTGVDRLRHNDAIQDVLGDYGIKMLSDYKPSVAYQMLNTYYKFMFVRDPFERLLSAYRDKIGNPNNEHYRPGREQLLRHYKSELLVPTFEQFLESLLRKPSRHYDVHWRPSYEMCQPCVVNYDFVGRIETLDADVNCVLPKLNMSSWFPRPRSARSSMSVLGNELDNIPLRLKYKIDAIYKKDTSLFGYMPLINRGSS